MEKSPGELWLPRIRKAPTSWEISISSAELRLAVSLNQLERKSKYMCVYSGLTVNYYMLTGYLHVVEKINIT